MEAKDKKFIFPFEKLDVWQLSVGLSDFVLSLLEGVPSSKHLRLCGQMESSVVSVAQNIAEGEGRQHRKEFIQFLHIAQGSLFEVVTLAEVFLRRGIFTKNDSIEIRSRCELIDRKLNGLINSVRGIGKRE
jgi:four helix bundle protein